MSTKASSLNASANNSPTISTAMNTSTTAATPTVVKIKKELPSDEIKEFAESTMNELLGWYGFDNVDRLDLSAKTSKLLQTAGILSSQQQQQHHQQHLHHQQHSHHHMGKRRSRSSRALLHIHQQQQQQNEHLRTLNNNNNNYNNNDNSTDNGKNNNNNTSNSSNSNNNRKSSLTNCHNIYRGGNDSTTSDHDTRSSRDDDSKSPNSAGKTYSSVANIIDEKIDYQNCCWCRRPIPENAPEFLTTSDGPRYCSESCFTQSRRASFKKAKTCDWCKHVRHAVSYVDFQDGASQLQFCSDKCLNQYKMQIFCRETQAHLDMNPHLKEQGLEAANNGANLITPDLWLRNCRSRSASPASTVSISPGPPTQTNLGTERSSLTGALSPLPLRMSVTSSLQHNNTASHKPLISVAPVSKLMSKSPSVLPSRQSPKHNRKKRPVRSCVTTDLNNTRGNDMKSVCSSSGSIKPKPLLAALNDNGRSNVNQTNTQTLTQFAASCVQDLHMSVPPLSPMMDSQSSQPSTPHSLPPTPNRGSTTIPAAFFATPPNTQGPQHTPTVGIPPQGFPQRPPFIHNPSGGFLPRFLGNFAGFPPPPPHTPASLIQPDLTALNTVIGTPPPITIMVPYPVIIPLPIPIPVPLPVEDFYKAYLKPEERKKFDEEQKLKKKNIINETPATTSKQTTANNAEEPLDFTKTKEAIFKTSVIQQEELKSSTKIMKESSPAEEEETSIQNSTLSEDSQSTSKSMLCILTSEEPEQSIEKASNILKSDFITNSSDVIEDSNEVQQSGNNVGDNVGGNSETIQKLPKLKITRLQTKRTLMQTKESECSRPLRKRKRIIDCDFQKLNNSAKESNDVTDELETTTENETSKCQNTTTATINSNNSNKK